MDLHTSFVVAEMQKGLRSEPERRCVSANQTAKSFAGVALLALLAAYPLAATAQDVPTVKVGQATKKMVGTVTATNSGDVACYLTLKDDRGVVFEEMAKFEICDQKPPLKGKRVSLTYVTQNVMSDECQGNPDCKKTRTVALVNTARIIEAAAPAPSGASTSAPTSSPSGTKQSSFCTPSETVVFSCRTGARMVSVCASKDAAPNKGTLQYRFGKLDQSEPPDLIPEGPVVPVKAAIGANVPFSGGGGSWLRFAHGQSTYTIYSGIGNWGPKGEKMTKEGLQVERAGKVVVTLKCLDKPVGVLGPDWFEKMGIKDNNQDFDFPD
jgi:hypothetical protein